jgi:hypothetical protein
MDLVVPLSHIASIVDIGQPGAGIDSFGQWIRAGNR